MRSGTNIWLLVEAVLLGVPVTLLTLFYLPWVLMYAGLILWGSLSNPLEGILFVWVSLFFLSGPLAVIAYWWLAWKVIRFSTPPTRRALIWATCVVISACCLFFVMFGGFPRTLASLNWSHALVIAPLLGWLHFAWIVHRMRSPPPLPSP